MFEGMTFRRIFLDNGWTVQGARNDLFTSVCKITSTYRYMSCGGGPLADGMCDLIKYLHFADVPELKTLKKSYKKT